MTIEEALRFPGREIRRGDDEVERVDRLVAAAETDGLGP
jgi:hypothetical protein